QRAFEPGAGHLKGVFAGDRVLVVEGVRDDLAGLTDGVEVETGGFVDRDAQDAGAELDVEEFKSTSGQERLYQPMDGVIRAHRTSLPSSSRTKQKRGQQPTLRHHPESNGTAREV